NLVQTGPTTILAAGGPAAIQYDFGPDKLTWALENKTDAPMPFYIVFDAAVIAVRNGKDEWLKTPLGSQADPPDAKWTKTTWFDGRYRITIPGGTRVWGRWEQRYQVWEATLAPKEKRTVTIETAPATADEVQKAAATAGVQPPPETEMSLNAPLD